MVAKTAGHKRSKLDDPQVINAISGGIAGALTAIVVCPLDVLKTRLQVQRSSTNKYTGIGGGLTRIVRDEGFRALYRGLGPSLLALLPNWAVYFTVYERLKTGISGFFDEKRPSTLTNMGAAAGAGVCTMAVTNPLWVVKTRLQTQNLGIRFKNAKSPELYRNTADALRRIWKEEGINGIYSGLGPSMFGVMHVVIQFPLYEVLKTNLAARHTNATKPEELSPLELIFASAVSKMVASTATYPHEVIRSRMHIGGGGAFGGIGRTCRQLYKEDGIRAFYRGCVTNLCRTTPAAAVTFTSFELITRQLKAWALRREEAADEAAGLTTTQAQAAAAAALRQAGDSAGIGESSRTSLDRKQ